MLVLGGSQAPAPMGGEDERQLRSRRGLAEGFTVPWEAPALLALCAWEQRCYEPLCVVPTVPRSPDLSRANFREGGSLGGDGAPGLGTPSQQE